MKIARQLSDPSNYASNSFFIKELNILRLIANLFEKKFYRIYC